HRVDWRGRVRVVGWDAAVRIEPQYLAVQALRILGLVILVDVADRHVQLAVLAETEPSAVVTADSGWQLLDDDRSIRRLSILLGEADDSVVLRIAAVVLGLG